MQFFEHKGRWIPRDLFKKIREIEIEKAGYFCPYCVSKAVRHFKDCPTRQEGFDKETAHELTKEEREELINKQNQ